MAEFTPNFNLKKPDETDFFNIEDFNGNMDILDEKLKEAIQNEQLQGDVTEIKGTTEEIKTSVGSSGDLSSSPTLFGRLAEIKETLISKFGEVISKITGVDEKIGTSGDSGTDTVFGNINSIYNYAKRYNSAISFMPGSKQIAKINTVNIMQKTIDNYVDGKDDIIINCGGFYAEKTGIVVLKVTGKRYVGSTSSSGGFYIGESLIDKFPAVNNVVNDVSDALKNIIKFICSDIGTNSFNFNNNNASTINPNYIKTYFTLTDKGTLGLTSSITTIEMPLYIQSGRFYFLYLLSSRSETYNNYMTIEKVDIEY